MYQKKVIFLIDIENFSAKFGVVLKILQVINSPKYVGITEIYLCMLASRQFDPSCQFEHHAESDF